MEIEFGGKTHVFPDDIDPQIIETVLKKSGSADWWSTVKAIPGVAVGQTQQSIGGITRGVGELIGSEDIAAAGAGIAESGKINVEMDTPANLSYWQRAVLSGASSALQSVPTLALSVASGGVAPALAGAAALAGGQTYGEVRAERPDLSAARAAGHAAVDAAAEAAFELLPTRFLIDNAGGPVLKLITGTMLREVPTEVATTAIQSANAKLSTRPDMTWDEYTQDLLDTVGATMVSAPLQGGVAGAIRRLDREQPEAAGGTNVALTPPSTPPSPVPVPPNAPQIDQPTTILPSDEQEKIKLILKSIDPTKITDAEVEEGNKLRAQLDAARKAPTDDAAVAAWAPTLDITAPDVGATQRQAENAYVNPNDAVPWQERQFFLSTVEGMQGKTPAQVKPAAGTHILGLPTDDRPEGMLRATFDTVEEWRKKYLPNATIVIANESLPLPTSLGAHASGAPGFHKIIPGVFRKPKDVKNFNPNTQAGVFYTLSHEFGHAIIDDRFYGDLDGVLAARIKQESQLGLVSEEAVAQLEPVRQAVVREYNNVKARIMDNSMTAQELVDDWIGPAKAGRKFLDDLDVAPQDNAMSVLQALERAAVQVHKIKGGKGIKAVREAYRTSFFSLDEYMAEQTARFAYKQKWDQSSQLGQYFKAALDSLRKFFIDNKKDGVIKPGVAFSEWLDGLSRADVKVNSVVRAVESKKKVGKVRAKLDAPPSSESSAGLSAKLAKVNKKHIRLDKVEHNVVTSTDEEKERSARTMVTNLVRSGAIEPNDPVFKELLGYVRDRDWQAFTDRFQQIAGKSVSWELDPEVKPKIRGPVVPTENVLDFTNPTTHAAFGRITEAEAKNPATLADAAREWSERGFNSKYFKSFFGDWLTEPHRSSKVRTHSGPPLILMHATRGDFTSFEKGDIGFHFGTLRASHNRHFDQGGSGPGTLEASHERYAKIGRGMAGLEPNLSPELAEEELRKRALDIRFIPAVLNIRNPIYFGEEDTGMWMSAENMIYALQANGFISEEVGIELRQAVHEHIAELAASRDPSRDYSLYDTMQPIRDRLLAMGYDGLQYTNSVEGDVSWVAFKPDQVKSLLGTKTFSRSKNMHFSLDYDLSKAEGEAANKIEKAFRPFWHNSGPVRRAMRWMQSIGVKVLEMQQLAQLNPEITPLQMWVRANTGYNTLKGKMLAAADKVIGTWSSAKLSKESHGKVGKALIAERDGGELWFGLENTPNGWRYTMTDRARLELKARGIDTDTALGEELAALVLAAKNAHIIQLNGWEEALTNVAMHRYAAGGVENLAKMIKPISRMVHEIRQRPFFPRGRFGNYIITVETRPEGSTKWTTVHKEAYESSTEWEKALAEAQKNAKPDERIRKHELTDQEVALLALPYDFIDLAASELGLSDEEGPDGEPSQVDRLMQILQPARPDKALKEYDLERLKMTGGDKDPMRSFAAFTWHNANLISKVQYRAEFASTIREVHSLLRKEQYSTEPGSLDRAYKLQRIESAMKSARDYVMHPANEMQMLRTFVSLAYLGLNVKTALMNFYGMVTTWSDLTSRFGQVQGNKLFLKSIAQALGTIKLSDLNDSRKVSYLPPDTREAFERAIEEGVLSQSYAYHLAGVANSGTLWQMPAGNSVKKATHAAVDASMWLFRLTELSTRRATFIAQFEAEKIKRTEELVGPYEQAVKRTNNLQNAYDLGNRVPFMRGGAGGLGPVAPLATIFMSFAQHMAFHAYGGYELGERRAAAVRKEVPRTVFGGYTMKLWLVTLLMAGYEGLPGAENVLDLIQALWRKFGGDKPVRQYLRETVQSLEIEWLTPGLAAHGLGHDIAGFDISRSIGFGRIVPGTDVLAHPRDNPSEQLGVLALDLLGPFGGFVKFGSEALMSDKPLGQSLERLPGGMGNIYSAYRWSEQGVRAPTQALITRDLETGQLRDLTADEIVGKALGFNPTIVSENRERRFAQYDRKIYWSTRREMLLDDMWRARMLKDESAIADTRKAVADFNASVPEQFRSIRISGQDIQRSMQSRRRNMSKDERGEPVERRYRGLYENVERSFE